MSFGNVRAVADAILLEGYVLYPYRATAVKNRYRWSFGVLAPDRWSERGEEPSKVRMECLVEGDPRTFRVRGLLRFLQIENRRVERCDEAGEPREVESLEVCGTLHLPWEEGKVREVEFGLDEPREFEIPGGYEIEWLREAGELRGRVLREWFELRGEVRASVEQLGPRLARLRIEVQNRSEADPESREVAVRHSMVSTHLLLAAEGGTFLSLLDPPTWAEAEAKRCENRMLHPVLAGAPGRGDLLLAAPFILYDHPAIAPESPGDFFDATEIDELLVLRTSTLTEAEKREARATDPQSARLIERVERLGPEEMERLHGAIRSRRPVAKEAPGLAPGSRVRIRASSRRTDAQDALYVGCVATVEKVMEDVSGERFLALTIDDDPAAELHRSFGRFHYYRLDEVEPIEP